MQVMLGSNGVAQPTASRFLAPGAGGMAAKPKCLVRIDASSDLPRFG